MSLLRLVTDTETFVVGAPDVSELVEAVLFEQLDEVKTPALFALEVLRQNRMVVTAELFGLTDPFRVALFFEILVATKVTAVGRAAGDELAATKLFTAP